MVQCFRILSLLSDDSFLVLLPLSNADTQMVCGKVTPQNLSWFLVSEVECPPWIRNMLLSQVPQGLVHK